MRKSEVAAAFALLSLAVLLLFSQFWLAAEQESSLDATWVQQLHAAFASQADFGTDFVFSYGPWGFVRQGYDPRTFGLAYAIRLALSILFAATAFALLRERIRPVIAAAVVLAIAGIAIPCGGEVLLTSFVLLLALAHFGERPRITVLLAIALGFCSVVKFTFLIFAVVAIAAISFDSIRRRRFPWPGVAYASSIPVWWLAASQPLRSLPVYLANSLEISRGYETAMTREPESVALFALFTLAVLLTWAGTALSHPRALPAAWLALFLFLIFRTGAVRADALHLTTASANLLVLLLLFSAVAERRKTLPLALAAAAGITCLAAGLWGSYATVWNRAARNFTYSISPSFKEKLEAERQALHRSARREYPLPRLEGRIDVYPHAGIAAAAAGLDYQPRPVIQSYSAFTPRLAAINAEFLRSSRAPDHIAFHRYSIDQRYPTVDDSLSWPYILTAYEPYLLGEMAILKRRAVPWRYTLVPLGSVTGSLGNAILLKQFVRPGALVWATIEVPSTFGARLRRTLLRAPALFIRTSVAPDYAARLPETAARSGFLLSPFIFEPAHLSAVAGGNVAAAPAVTAIQVEAAEGQTDLWTGDVTITLWEIAVRRDGS